MRGQGRQRHVRPAIIAVGGRACTGWDVGEEKESERARYGRRQRKDGHDEWNQMLEIGCSGQRKDFRELGFRF